MSPSLSMSPSITTPSSARAAAAPQGADPAQRFQQLDTDQKGYLTASDLASAVVTLSPEGVQRSAEQAQAVAQAAVARMDGDGDGQVSQQEFTAAAPPAQPPSGDGAAAAAGPPAGGRPQGAPHAGGGGPAGASSASSAPGQTYDPADANEDGTVSEPERQAYDTRHPAAAEARAAASATAPARDRRASEAVQAYEAVAEA